VLYRMRACAAGAIMTVVFLIFTMLGVGTE
jgi:hypothetical protein